ncbi:MAG: hypothetical protein IPL52_11355 [Flavobacteriales bacterium]|nr:hypothetical protein [Flavobacteriales bacterium]
MDFAGITMTASGQDAFVAKYDTNGQEIWARQMGGAFNDGSYSVAVDGLGRVHVGGYFRGTADFGSTTLVATHDTTGFMPPMMRTAPRMGSDRGGLNSNDGTTLSQHHGLRCAGQHHHGRQLR